MTFVVDCSVALKWVLIEEGREAALDLIGQRLIAPEFLKLECANVLAMRARKNRVSEADARRSLAEIEDLSGLEYKPISPYINHAQALALELQQTAYDCLYLALALRERATLVTADGKFLGAVRAHSVYRSIVRAL